MRRFGLLILLIAAAFPVFAQDAAPLDPATLTATELARLPLYSGPTDKSSHLAPDGEHLMHVSRDAFCLYTLEGDELSCVSPEEQTGMRFRIDHETVTWSPDGRYLAFTGDALVTLTDADIWVFDVEAGEFRNLTDDGYEGSLGILGDREVPEGVWVDLAPEWMPDGRLTFIRHALDFEAHEPELWVVEPDGGEAEKMADLIAPSGFRSYIYNMDWSPDGTQLAFNYDSMENPFAGLWIYDAVEGEVSPLLYVNERDQYFMRADFSPDGESVLLLTSAREAFRGGQPDPEAGSGYYVVSVETLEAQPLIHDGMFILSVGWLPDGGLIYVGHDQTYRVENASGLFVTAAPDAEPRKVLDYLDVDGDRMPFFAPTPRQYRPLNVQPDGRFLLGTIGEVTAVVQLTAE